MSWGFHTDLIVKDIDGDTWLLMQPLIYEAKNGTRYTVNAGVTTDLASIPRFFWRFYPKSGPWNEAAVLHDCRYTEQDVTRAEADALFLEAMEWLNVKPSTRRIFYYGVRVGGWKAWGDYADRKAHEED